MRLCSPWILSVVSMVMFASVGVSQGPRPRAEWVFEESRLSGGTLRASIGGAHATVHGVLTFQEGSHWQAGVFTGSTGSTIELDYRPGKKPLPRQSITAEAWVKLDAGGQWGGMVSVLQDNGAFEKGWLLGFYKNRFCFALSSVGADDGDGLMTYMAADKAFSTKGWHHVAGTYNGKKMRLFVDGSLAKESEVQSGAILYPKRAKFVLGAYRDDNEHYPIKGQMRSVALWSKALTASQIKSRYKANCPPPAPEPLAGPVVRHLPDNAVSVSWRTEKLEPTAIWTGLKGESRKRFAKAGKRRDHELVLQGVTKEADHEFQIEFSKRHSRSRIFRFDSTFDYAAIPKSGATASAIDSIRRLCAANTSDTPKAGFALLIGAGDGEVALEMARTSRLKVVVVEPDPEKAQRLRIRASQEALYGSHLSVQNSDLRGVRMPRWFANVICFPSPFDDKEPLASAEDVFRCLRPDGGVVVVPKVTPSSNAWIARLSALMGVDPTLQTMAEALHLWRLKRPTLAGTDSWTHQYANPAHTAATADELVKGDIELLWYGPPGPRPMLDRGARSPAPVADNGRLFIQGNGILFGLDAFNGAILWSMHTPGLRRVNIPRDGTNMVVDRDELLLAEGAVCRRINAGTGEVLADLQVPATASGAVRHWGYLAAQGGRVYGSTSRPAAVYTGAEGQWYDGGGSEAFKVTSDSLFAMDAHDGRVVWQYRKKSVIINSTIVLHNGRVYFCECRNPEAIKDATGRIGAALEKGAFLTALREKDGKRLWSHEIDISQSERTLYLCASDDVLLLSMSKKSYALRGFNAKTGKPLWSTDFNWRRNHHGGAMQHPVITESVVYLEQSALDLKTGEVTRKDLPERRGCGTLSGSKGALFYRHYSHGMFDIETNKRTEYFGIRSGCWLGIIPSEGLLLLPETSSGCSCSKDPIQISMAMAPVENRGK